MGLDSKLQSKSLSAEPKYLISVLLGLSYYFGFFHTSLKTSIFSVQHMNTSVLQRLSFILKI